MQTVQRFVTSARPDIVWKVLADVEQWHTWTPTIVEIKPLGNEGLRTGARYRVTQPKLAPAVFEVTECTPNKAFTWANKLWGGAMIADHRLAPVSAGTEVELSFRSTGFLANVVGMLFSKLIREYVATEARSLKQRCEAA
jgi:hypothetical protein